jgi:ribosomal protein S27AE
MNRWATRWNEIMRHGKPLEHTGERPKLTPEQVRRVAYECEAVAYRILSDPSVSRTTAGMSEEGREAVAEAIANRLRVELETTPCPSCGSTRVMTDNVTGLWCAECDYSVLWK